MNEYVWEKFFYVLIIVAVLLRIFFVFELPYGQVVKMKLEGLNDEPSHFNYVKHLAKDKQFPIQKISVQHDSAFVINGYEYYQPPLYYMLCAPFKMIFTDKVALFLSRLISLLFGLLLSFVIYKLIILLGYSRITGLFAVVLNLNLLSFSYFSCVCSNDSLSWIFPVILIYFYFRWYKLEQPYAHSLLIGVIIGCGLLAKSSNTCLIVFCVLIMAYNCYLHCYKKVLIWGIGILIGLLISSPWYLRNLSVYGSLMALEVGFGKPNTPDIPLHLYLYSLVRPTIALFWFPMQHVYPGKIKHILDLLGIGIVGFYLVVFAIWTYKLRRLHIAITFMSVLMIAVFSFVMMQLKWCNPEGRYLFTALMPIVFIQAVTLPELVRDKFKDVAMFFLLLVTFLPYCYFLLV